MAATWVRWPPYITWQMPCSADALQDAPLYSHKASTVMFSASREIPQPWRPQHTQRAEPPPLSADAPAQLDTYDGRSAHLAAHSRGTKHITFLSSLLLSGNDFSYAPEAAGPREEPRRRPAWAAPQAPRRPAGRPRPSLGALSRPASSACARGKTRPIPLMIYKDGRLVNEGRRKACCLAWRHLHAYKENSHFSEL